MHETDELNVKFKSMSRTSNEMCQNLPKNTTQKLSHGKHTNVILIIFLGIHCPYAVRLDSQKHIDL